MNTSQHHGRRRAVTLIALLAAVVVLALSTDANAALISSKLAFQAQFGAGVITGSAAGTGELTAGSTVVRSVVTTNHAFIAGETVTGAGIPTGTTITEIPSRSGSNGVVTPEPDTLRLSQPASATAAGVVLSVTEGSGHIAVNEKQTVTVAGATGGSFTLSFTSPQPDHVSATTSAITYPASAAAVRSALEGLSSIGAGGVTVTGASGGPYTIEFTGRYADTSIAQLQSDSTGLTPSGAAMQVTTIREGAGAGETCTVFTSCLPGRESSEPGGFLFPNAVAVNTSTGNLYVADADNNRVQEFTSTGTFVLMFGWDVNRAKVKEDAPQAERNLCTAAQVTAGAECGAGEAGVGLPGQVYVPEDIAVDPSTGHVFVYEPVYRRIEEFTETGQFVLMVGREVNETISKRAGAGVDEKNLCTAVQVETEAMTCRAGSAGSPESREHNAFNLASSSYGDLLAFGGPKNLLYVGDRGRVQEIDPSGKWEGELPLGPTTTPAFSALGSVTALAVDSAGDVYVTESSRSVGHNEVAPPGVYEFDPAGVKIGEFDTSSSTVEDIALDPFGHLAVVNAVLVPGNTGSYVLHGELIELSSGRVLSRFAPPGGLGNGTGEEAGLAFNGEGELYVADTLRQDVESYRPVPTVQVETEACKDRAANEVTFAGTVSSNSVAGTEAWFEYGTSTALGLNTAKRAFPTGTGTEPFEMAIDGLAPNTVYDYLVAAEDVNDPAPEPPIIGETVACKTRAIPPVIPGAPEGFASGATFTAASLAAKIDPEHARTVYRFQYAPFDPATCPELDACTDRNEGTVFESTEDALLTAQETLKGLQPSTTYLYRLVGDNSLVYGGEPEGGETKGQEGTFTTIAAPTVSAATLGASGVGVNGATIAGRVNGDGFPATYAFEVGIDEGASTRYGTVLSGAVGGSSLPEEKTLVLSGLQPGTTYAYRVAVTSGYVTGEANHTVYGAVRTFTTQGLPDVLAQPAVLAQVPVPSIAFPVEEGKVNVRRVVKCKRGYARNKHGVCVKVKSKKKTKQTGGKTSRATRSNRTRRKG